MSNGQRGQEGAKERGGATICLHICVKFDNFLFSYTSGVIRAQNVSGMALYLTVKTIFSLCESRSNFNRVKGYIFCVGGGHISPLS